MKLAVGLVIVLILFGLAMSSDYEDAVALDRAYCENVSDGTWPDYRGTFKEDCPGMRKPLRHQR